MKKAILLHMRKYAKVNFPKNSKTTITLRVFHDYTRSENKKTLNVLGKIDFPGPK
jgi:hypothetical protein